MLDFMLSNITINITKLIFEYKFIHNLCIAETNVKYSTQLRYIKGNVLIILYKLI